MYKLLHKLPVNEVVSEKKSSNVLPILLSLIGLGIVVYVIHINLMEEKFDKKVGVV